MGKRKKSNVCHVETLVEYIVASGISQDGLDEKEE